MRLVVLQYRDRVALYKNNARISSDLLADPVDVKAHLPVGSLIEDIRLVKTDLADPPEYWWDA